MTTQKQYYCTKWWKSDGATPIVMYGGDPNPGGYVTLCATPGGAFCSCMKLGVDCFPSLDEANKRIASLVKKEIHLLEKKLAKLKALLP
jgi:hypothetical protein